MKESHRKTPRRLDQCEFQLWADPIERDEERNHRPDQIVMAGLVVLSIMLAVILFIWG